MISILLVILAAFACLVLSPIVLAGVSIARIFIKAILTAEVKRAA